VLLSSLSDDAVPLNHPGRSSRISAHLKESFLFANYFSKNQKSCEEPRTGLNCETKPTDQFHEVEENNKRYPKTSQNIPKHAKVSQRIAKSPEEA